MGHFQNIYHIYQIDFNVFCAWFQPYCFVFNFRKRHGGKKVRLTNSRWLWKAKGLNNPLFHWATASVFRNPGPTWEPRRPTGERWLLVRLSGCRNWNGRWPSASFIWGWVFSEILALICHLFSSVEQELESARAVEDLRLEELKGARAEVEAMSDRVDELRYVDFIL